MGFWEECVEALEEAFLRPGAGETHQPSLDVQMKPLQIKV